MRARKDNPEWVQNLRGVLRESIGPSFSVAEQAGKAKLTIRFQGGKRKVATLPIEWEKPQSRTIQDAIEEIARQINNGKSFEEAIAAVKQVAPVAPKAANDPNPVRLLVAWTYWGKWIRSTGEVKQKTWDVDYFKTEKRLKEVASATSAHDLLERIGMKWEPGIRQRQQAVRHVASMLRWAVSKEGKFALPADSWTPPPKGGLGSYIGKKSSEKKAEESPTVPLSDNQILELLASLPLESNHPRDRDSAKRWDFALRLMACYGLRPVEIAHLEIRRNGKDCLWCTYHKKSGGGIGKPRRLWPLHPEWESEWNLIERVANKDPLPPAGGGVGDAARRYLLRNPIWQKIKAESGAVPKSFRHGYARRGHQDYGFSDTDLAAMMGHTVEVHNGSYAMWTSESHLETSMERAMRYRDVTSESN